MNEYENIDAQSCRVSVLRELFDDAQGPKIEAFIKNLRKLAGGARGSVVRVGEG